jgi:hypothetical protein
MAARLIWKCSAIALLLTGTVALAAWYVLRDGRLLYQQQLRLNSEMSIYVTDKMFMANLPPDVYFTLWVRYVVHQRNQIVGLVNRDLQLVNISESYTYSKSIRKAAETVPELIGSVRSWTLYSGSGCLISGMGISLYLAGTSWLRRRRMGATVST